MPGLAIQVKTYKKQNKKVGKQGEPFEKMHIAQNREF